MSNLYLTLIVTFLLIVIGIACLAAGWLITGRKSRYEKYREQIKKTTTPIEPSTKHIPPKIIQEKDIIEQDVIIEKEIIPPKEDSNKPSV